MHRHRMLLHLLGLEQLLAPPLVLRQIAPAQAVQLSLRSSRKQLPLRAQLRLELLLQQMVTRYESSAIYYAGSKYYTI